MRRSALGIVNRHICQFLTKLSSRDTKVAGYYHFMFLLLLKMLNLHKLVPNFGVISLP